MPHAVIEGEVDLERVAREFQPILLRRGADVLRADRVYLESRGRALLVESLVVEGGRKLPFYVRISRQDRGAVTLRVDPLTHPERSPGVRALVAHLAGTLLAATPGATLGSTNLVLPSLGVASETGGSTGRSRRPQSGDGR